MIIARKSKQPIPAKQPPIEFFFFGISFDVFSESSNCSIIFPGSIFKSIPISQNTYRISFFQLQPNEESFSPRSLLFQLLFWLA